ncbi:MAG: 16S rRNA processing protein RimM [Mesorhizobium amorphae]|nr:MAG: 16S rRNA processing protein RimM [Mesorhizobium amorphae]
MAEDRVEMGVIGAPQGLKGEVRVKSFTADPQALGTYGPLLTDDGRQLPVEAARALKGDMLVMRFKGVGDRTAAEKLTGTRLFIERSRLPAPDEEEFYHADLVGLAVRDGEGTVLGRVVAVHDFGGGDVLEIEAGKRVMIPFSRAAVPVVDIAGGFVAIDPLAAGLLDDGDETQEQDEA